MSNSMQTYQMINRLPESEKIRIGYRDKDFLENWHCQTCFQKTLATGLPIVFTWVYLKEYESRYENKWPFLRFKHVWQRATPRQRFHLFLPVFTFSVALWWGELTYNRCNLGIAGAEPIPDQALKR